MNWKFAFQNPKVALRKAIHRLPNHALKRRFMKFPSSEKIIGQLEKLQNESKNKECFIFPLPGCPWGYMFQRPQQMARALGNKGYTVIYCVDTSFTGSPDWDVRGLKCVGENLYLFNDGQSGRTLNFLQNKMVVWKYWPHQTDFLNRLKLKNKKIIYDCIDHLSTFIYYKDIEKDHINSLAEADLVIATADKIFNNIKKKGDNCLLIPNAVSLEDFSGDYIQDIPYELKTKLEMISKESDQIVGYYGALADWVDFDLIEYCARKNPGWTFLLVGVKYPNISIPKLPNIEIWGEINYRYIPALLSYFDVAILPFKKNEITQHTSPVKIFEYMAGKKPIVSTKLYEIQKYDVVLSAEGNEEFNEKLNIGIQLKTNQQYLDLLIQCSLENSWDQRAEVVLNNLKNRGFISNGEI
ncbi:glycosyltransferase [Paenibacillus sp. J2TS4]|uniref:glycosyltransferase n=1 Tax=Paenibacillus sp. J2TS4 TaxID=2807194 RepID=UPI001AFF3E19|nr:glycosyltransferase [Paenibacillus sp. J2TS4]GIP35118.1 hypothetical protein J2TS4_43280 [Paenibacillus sp. J2TS4]